MKKLVLAAFVMLLVGIITPSCGDDTDVKRQEIKAPTAPAPANDGNNEGDPDGGG